MVLVPALALELSACQSNGTMADALDPESLKEAHVDGNRDSGGPAQAKQSLGKGGVNISMLLPLSAPGSVGENGRRMRDAAQLAMSDLGNDLITLTIEDTRGDSAVAKQLAVKALGSGAKAVIGPTELPAAKHLASITGTKKPVVLALADNFDGGPGVYSVRLSEADSAAAGAAAIAEKGARKFVLFVAAGPHAAAVEKRVANSLSIYGASLAVTIPYSPGGNGGEKAVADMAALVSQPEAIVIASGSDSPSTILSSLRSGKFGKGAVLIGTSRWLEHPISGDLYEGAYIATLDQTETGPIAVRFKSAFNSDADANVAYSYDMVALTAGIASAVGPEGFKREVLENRTGFRGSTGVFRFRADGGSERAMPFYRIEKGSLKKIAKSTSSF